MIDYNVRAERMGWLPSARRSSDQPAAGGEGRRRRRHGPQGLRGQAAEGRFAEDEPATDPDARQLAAQHVRLALQHPGLSAARATSTSSSTCWAPATACRARTWARRTQADRGEVARQAPEGKLDLLVTLDFRMSTTCLYSDIVLPTATWYEKNDLNTSDMHPFIHPLSRRWTRPGNRAATGRSTRASPRSSARSASATWASRRTVVLTPLMHDTPASWPALRRQGLEARRVRADPRQDGAADRGGRARLPERLQALHRLGPLMNKLGNGGKGIGWNTADRGRAARRAQRLVRDEGVTKGMPKIETDIDACEVVLQLAPETNGHVAVKAWEALGKHHRPRPHAPGAVPRGREDPLPRHPGAAAQDHQLAHLERHRERDRQLQRRLHQRARADPLAHAHRPPAVLPGPPVDAGLRRGLLQLPPAGGPEDHKRHPCTTKPATANPEILLNFITPHQKWGIHSTYTDNLMMLTLSAAGRSSG
jgi:nitrate reductase alpha subunit